MAKKTTWEIEGIKKFSKLNTDTSTDVVIIGGGLAGIWSAYLLSKSGKKVVLIESDRVGRGATMYTTAFITQVIDTDLSQLIDMYGKRTARLSWESHGDAIDQIESVIKIEKIDCEFKRIPMVVYANDKEGLDSLIEEDKVARGFGFNTNITKQARLGFKNYGIWEIKNQAKYHPMKFFNGLLEACLRQGVVIYEKTEALKINTARGAIKVTTKDNQLIKANNVVVTTYQPFNNPKPTHFKKGMYTSYVYELKIPKGVIKEGMYEDLHNPYHYVRVDSVNPDRDRMILGGEDHRAEIKMEKKSFRALEDFMKETFPTLNYEIVTKWQGGILEPSDGLALIGMYAPNQYVASAFSGNGMTYAAISGKIITDLINGKQNKYSKIYDPERTLTAKALFEKAKDYTGELFGGAVKNLFK